MNTTALESTGTTVAIVGAGPSGCYTAQFLRKAWPTAEIVIFERLAVPHGLVRYGVAPDHVGTKAIARQFDRLFERDGVHFVGNSIVGTHAGVGTVSIAELRTAFDVVVLATGLHADRPLGDAAGIPLDGADLSGVYGAGRLTRLINGHPDEGAAEVRLGNRVAIVGHGNVAIDLLRLFLTEPARLRELGIAGDVVEALTAGPITDIDIIGRSLPAAAKFDSAMIRELAKLGDVRFESDGLEAPVDETDAAASARRNAVAALVDESPASAGRRVRFRFGWTPRSVLGDTVVTGLELESVDDSATVTVPADSICSAIGFTERDDAEVRRAEHEHPELVDLEHGVLGDGLYCVGWLRRGPRGTIPENRADARMVADTIVASTPSGGKPGLRAIRSHSISPEDIHPLIKELA